MCNQADAFIWGKCTNLILEAACPQHHICSLRDKTAELTYVAPPLLSLMRTQYPEMAAATYTPLLTQAGKRNEMLMAACGSTQ
jgi:hypothetical protein